MGALAALAISAALLATPAHGGTARVKSLPGQVTCRQFVIVSPQPGASQTTEFRLGMCNHGRATGGSGTVFLNNTSTQTVNWASGGTTTYTINDSSAETETAESQDCTSGVEIENRGVVTSNTGPARRLALGQLVSLEPCVTIGPLVVIAVAEPGSVAQF